MPTLDILVVDDEPDVRESIVDILRSEGHTVDEAGDGLDALSRMDKHPFDLVVSDVRLPRCDGFTLLRRVRTEAPWTDVLLITAFGSIPDAINAVRERAADYLPKPFDERQLLDVINRISERRRIEQAVRAGEGDEKAAGEDRELIGRAPVLRRLLLQLEAVAKTSASVLIVGETGTGKELVARGIHKRSDRAQGPFVAINCAAFPVTLLEAELFGHERGAFTGAVQKREGRFAAAHGGTLLLDEIGEMPVDAQAKLLRTLQEGTLQSMGTNVARKVDVRVLAATNIDLKASVDRREFRPDLYYRLKVVEMRVPPLRERMQDLPALVGHFLHRYAATGPLPTISPAAWGALQRYPFPGNVRELEHTIEHALIMSGGHDIGLEHLPDDIAGVPGEERADSPAGASLPEALDAFEREFIRRALDANQGQRAKTAQALGISRKSLWQRMLKHRLS